MSRRRTLSLFSTGCTDVQEAFLAMEEAGKAGSCGNETDRVSGRLGLPWLYFIFSFPKELTNVVLWRPGSLGPTSQCQHQLHVTSKRSLALSGLHIPSEE